jgi:Ca2+-binding EF-hand superfamily protein
MLKLTFNLKVDRAELGAVLKEFNPNLDDAQIPASEFLRYFLRLGLDARDKARAEQRQKQLEMNHLAEQESVKKLTEAGAKMNLEVDYNFSEAAEESAKEKLLIASTKYDRYATGAVALDGFECESLDPGAFKDLIRRVFNLNLNSGELGYVIQKYDTKRTGRVVCKAFLTDFLRMGQEARYKAHVEQLERQRLLNQQAEEEHHKKILAVQNSETLKMSDRFGDKHLQSALAKLTAASLNYDKVRGVSLISFEPATLSPLEFKKALKRTFNLKLTPQEMGAAVDYFDKDGSKQVNTLILFALLSLSGRCLLRSCCLLILFCI